MLHPDLIHQIGEAVRLAAIRKTENPSTKRRIAGMEDADILTLVPEPHIIPRWNTSNSPKRATPEPPTTGTSGKPPTAHG
jgi:hypothetical protein